MTSMRLFAHPPRLAPIEAGTANGVGGIVRVKHFGPQSGAMSGSGVFDEIECLLNSGAANELAAGLAFCRLIDAMKNQGPIALLGRPTPNGGAQALAPAAWLYCYEVANCRFYYTALIDVLGAGRVTEVRCLLASSSRITVQHELKECRQRHPLAIDIA